MEEGASNDHADNGHISDDDENKEMLKMALSSYHPLKGEEEAPPLFCPKSSIERDFPPLTTEARIQLRQRKHEILGKYMAAQKLKEKKKENKEKDKAKEDDSKDKKEEKKNDEDHS
uniref:DET1- and DDB1-associated protein 1 n=3 Tax=Meloidogyne TaxID=189290 RepID=A0A915MVB3_MELJA